MEKRGAKGVSAREDASLLGGMLLVVALLGASCEAAPSVTMEMPPSPSVTATQTLTNMVTSTPTITPTPTVALPVGMGTLLPEIAATLAPENISSVQELARYGTGEVNRCFRGNRPRAAGDRSDLSASYVLTAALS